MSRSRFNVVIVGASVLGFLAATMFAADSTSTPPSKQNYSDRYGVLSDHNIFMRERGRPVRSAYASTSSTQSSQYAPRPPEASYVLTGIVLEDGQYRAYVEDVSSGRVLRLGVGDTVARGHVLEIEIDAIAYSVNGQGTWITVGSDLRGQPFSSFPSALSRYMSTTSTSSSGGGSTTGPSTGGSSSLPIDPNAPNLSIEERMRLRRLQGK